MDEVTSPPPANLVLARALHLARAGFVVFPCRQGDKRPATNNGLLDASSDESVVRRWFANDRGFNLAVACGPQPNGVNLLAIDIDPKNGGDVAWHALLNGHAIPPCPVHTTPSDGRHLFFDMPLGLHNTSGRLGPGIDTRGVGGYVVVPPSRLVDTETGEVRHYTTERSSALSMRSTPPLPRWLIEMLGDEAVGPVPPRVPDPLNLGDSVADKAREGWVWEVELDRDGWSRVRGRGDQEYWSRPGKNPREGHSAVLHGDDGPLVVFTTERPPGGRDTRDGVGSSFSPWDYIVAYRAGGDTRRAARLVRGPTARQPDFDEGTGGHPVDAVNDMPLNLPAEFWTQRPHLVHIHRAARSAGCSPDALLVHALARTATMIHPCFKLPGAEQGLIGKHQTFDFLGCVVAETSGGKTMAAGVGEMLIPQPDPPTDGSDPPIDFEQLVGSGEGISEFFLVDEMRDDEDGKPKPTGKRVIGKQALFMNVDEGTGFVNQAGRKGATIVSTLASAWSGEAMGQLNASADTRRLVRGGRVRVCAVINMQDSNGYKLYTDDLESVGFTGRLLFASAHDPAAPAPGSEPPWPGLLRWPVAGGFVRSNVYYTYDPAIAAEIRSTRWGILTKQVQIDRRQSQYLLLRCKVAGVLATWEGRTHITTGDWQIATQIIKMSAACLANLDSFHSSSLEVTAVTAAAFKMGVAEKATSMHVRQLQAGWRAKIIERLRSGPQPWRELKKIVDSTRRADLKACLIEMINEGIVVVNEKRYELGR